PAVHAVPGDVEPAADEPGRPFRAAREIDDLVPWPRELDPHVLDRRRPEPLRLLGREAHERGVILEPELAREAQRVGPLAHLVARRPDNLHAGKRNLTPSASAR